MGNLCWCERAYTEAFAETGETPPAVVARRERDNSTLVKSTLHAPSALYARFVREKMPDLKGHVGDINTGALDGICGLASVLAPGGLVRYSQSKLANVLLRWRACKAYGHAHDLEMARELWVVSESACGCRFDIAPTAQTSEHSSSS